MTLKSDVEKLKKNPTLKTKKDVTEKIAQYYNQGVFDKNEAHLAIEVMTLLAHDAEIQIRKTLSESLKNNRSIPHDLALRLAQDVAEVAIPMLEFSSLLTQEDLVNIVRASKEITALNAIAGRDDVTEPLSNALIDSAEEKVIHTLVNNKKAAVSENDLREVLIKFASSNNIIDALVSRGSLPIGIVEQMLEVVSSNLKKQLIKQYNLPEKVAGDIVTATHEQATLEMILVSDNDRIVQGLIDHLYENKSLTQSIILRALCKGDFNFFERGLAKLANIPLETTHNILHGQGATNFAQMYKKADMPEGAFAAVNVIWQFALSELKNGTFDKTTYANRIIEYITENGYDKKINIMQYFMILIKSKITNDDAVY